MLLEEADRHLLSAERIAGDDPNGAYQLLYDGARKAISAHMLANGLRVSMRRPRAHEAIGRYAKTAFEAPEAATSVGQFDRIRRSRNRSEYEVAFFEEETIRAELEHARRILAAVKRSLT